MELSTGNGLGGGLIMRVMALERPLSWLPECGFSVLMDAVPGLATKLASTWDAPAEPVIGQQTAPEASAVIRSLAKPVAADEIEVVSGPTASSVIPEALETVREQAAHGATEIDMDAVVARVLERMSPDRLQEVARDLLKPVIETIVREELAKRS